MLYNLSASRKREAHIYIIVYIIFLALHHLPFSVDSIHNLEKKLLCKGCSNKSPAGLI